MSADTFPECPKCGKNHKPLVQGLDHFSLMDADQFNAAVEEMSLDEFFCYFSNINQLCGFLGSVALTIPAWEFNGAMAAVFGTLAFDAEMRVAINPKYQDDPRRMPTFEDRVRLFTTIARKTYEEVKEQSRTDPSMYHGIDGATKLQ